MLSLAKSQDFFQYPLSPSFRNYYWFHIPCPLIWLCWNLPFPDELLLGLRPGAAAGTQQGAYHWLRCDDGLPVVLAHFAPPRGLHGLEDGRDWYASLMCFCGLTLSRRHGLHH